jgi:hypothetical protein
MFLFSRSFVMLFGVVWFLGSLFLTFTSQHWMSYPNLISGLALIGMGFLPIAVLRNAAVRIGYTLVLFLVGWSLVRIWIHYAWNPARSRLGFDLNSIATPRAVIGALLGACLTFCAVRLMFWPVQSTATDRTGAFRPLIILPIVLVLAVASFVTYSFVRTYFRNACHSTPEFTTQAQAIEAAKKLVIENRLRFSKELGNPEELLRRLEDNPSCCGARQRYDYGLVSNVWDVVLVTDRPKLWVIVQMNGCGTVVFDSTYSHG